jgi:hypothetical protein
MRVFGGILASVSLLECADLYIPSPSCIQNTESKSQLNAHKIDDFSVPFKRRGLRFQEQDPNRIEKYK